MDQTEISNCSKFGPETVLKIADNLSKVDEISSFLAYILSNVCKINLFIKNPNLDQAYKQNYTEYINIYIPIIYSLIDLSKKSKKVEDKYVQIFLITEFAKILVKNLEKIIKNYLANAQLQLLKTPSIPEITKFNYDMATSGFRLSSLLGDIISVDQNQIPLKDKSEKKYSNLPSDIDSSFRKLIVLIKQLDETDCYKQDCANSYNEIKGIRISSFKPPRPIRTKLVNILGIKALGPMSNKNWLTPISAFGKRKNRRSLKKMSRRRKSTKRKSRRSSKKMSRRRKSKRSGRKRSVKRRSRRFGKKWPKVETINAHRTGQAPVKIPGLVQTKQQQLSSAVSAVSEVLPDKLKLKETDIKPWKCCDIDNDFKKLIEQFRKINLKTGKTEKDPVMIKFIEKLYIFVVKHLDKLILETGSIFNVFGYNDPLNKKISEVIACENEIGIDLDSQCVVKCLELIILQIRKFIKDKNSKSELKITVPDSKKSLIEFYNTNNFLEYIYTDYTGGGLWYVITNNPCITKS